MRTSAVAGACILLTAASAFGGELAAALAGDQLITAGIVAHELKDLGFDARIDQDNNGDPRVNTKVDGYEWSIYFYDCASGALEERGCASYQFYSGYVVPASFPVATINKWNTEKRYAKAYTQTDRDHSNHARLEVDVLVTGTGADPARSFRANLVKMRNAAEGFRKAIGFQN